MARDMGGNDVEVVEKLIDQFGLSGVFGALADVCYGKSEHVASNWGDESLAKLWERAGGWCQTMVKRARDAGLTGQ